MTCKNCPTPRAPDKCGALPALSGKATPTADSASGSFSRQIPRLPVTPAVGRFLINHMQNMSILDLQISLEQNRYLNASEEQDHFERLLKQSGPNRAGFVRWVLEAYKGFIDTRKQAGIYYLHENRDEALLILEKLIHSDDPDDRDTANELLQELNEPFSYELIRILLKDLYPYLQFDACEFLKEKYPEEVRETLKELLNNNDEQVRRTAENQLKQLNLSER
jgi:hypothetical protein